MSTLLRIDSSPFPGEASFSRQLTSEFAAQWRESHPDGRVTERDLAETPLAPPNAAWVAAAYTPEANRTPEQTALLAQSDQLIAELHDADEYVFGVPMHNFSIPSGLKLWIDQVARAGKTFSYGSGGPVGLLKNKKATVLMATGGVYDQNHIEPYLRSVLAFWGVTDVTFINAGGTARARAGVDRGVILAPAKESIRAQFRAA